MRNRILKYLYIAVLLLFALLFVAAFGGNAILKAYVTAGLGDCSRMPIFCRLPEKEISNPVIDRTYISELLPYAFPAQEAPYPFPGMQISVPKGFAVVRGNITKVYYKRKKYGAKTPTVYLLYQKPGFFISLYPQLKNYGIENNYEFVSRTVYAQLDDINNITDAFFVIMKSVFTPNLGEQENLRVFKFTTSDKRGFISYNQAPAENYFDCDVIDNEDAFFKIYIKDKDKSLDLDKVLAIISTLDVSR